MEEQQVRASKEKVKDDIERNMATGGGGTSSLIRDDLNRQARPLQQNVVSTQTLPQHVGLTQTLPQHVGSTQTLPLKFVSTQTLPQNVGSTRSEEHTSELQSH